MDCSGCVKNFNNGITIAWVETTGNTSTTNSKSINFPITFRKVYPIIARSSWPTTDYTDTGGINRMVLSHTVGYTSLSTSKLTCGGRYSLNIILIGY